MKTLDLFDCNAFLGMRNQIQPGSFYSKDDLLQKMKTYGINRALVHHAYARELDPLIGNQRLLEEIQDSPSLYPVWTVLPHHTGEFPEPKELLKNMEQSNVRAVVLFPNLAYHFYSLAAYTMHPLFSTLEQANVPVFLSLAQIDQNWDTVHSICTQYPSLPLVITEVNYRIDRHLYPLLAQHKNLYIETSGYKVQDGIKMLCKTFGAQRLLFGTGLPIFSGSASVGLLTYAEITWEEKEQIGFKNLERLLERVDFHA